MTRHWMRYTVGAVGISLFSVWLVGHSRLAGSPDIDNWIRDAKASVTDFLNHHVEQPVRLVILYNSYSSTSLLIS